MTKQLTIFDQTGKRGLDYLCSILSNTGISAARIDTIKTATLERLASGTGGLLALEQHWFNVLDTAPDYSVYDDDLYVAETYVCWTTYSQKYCKMLSASTKYLPDGLINELGKVDTVVDLGCGHGFSTAALKLLFPDSKVIGTNLPNNLQWDVASVLAAEHKFDLLPVISATPASIVFASEYFEHFYEPVKHLNEVLKNLSPKFLIVANAFGQIGTGHFHEYLVDGLLINGKDTNKAFAKVLRANGYEKLTTGFWNSRPTVWYLT